MCVLYWHVSTKFLHNYESFFSLPFVQGGRPELRRVTVPPHRFTPLKENWMKIFSPIVDHLKLQIRLNLKTRNVELKVIILLCSVPTAVKYMCM